MQNAANESILSGDLTVIQWGDLKLHNASPLPLPQKGIRLKFLNHTGVYRLLGALYNGNVASVQLQSRDIVDTLNCSSLLQLTGGDVRRALLRLPFEWSSARANRAANGAIRVG